MKRVFIIAALLVVAAACATQGPASNAPANTTANTNVPTTKSESLSEADVMAKEKQVWDAIKKKDFDGFAAFLSDDQVYVSSQGVKDKKTSLDGMKSGFANMTMTDYSFTDFKTLPLDKDAVVVFYTATAKGTMDGKDFPPMAQRNSSVWANRGGKWQVVFHQETDVAKAEQPVGTALTPKPPAGLTEADPIAREKQVWEAINKKDWDSFSSVLANEQMEVEAEGVYDRVGTVNGVSQAKMPEMTLSDLKATKIDDDAVIVTYTVKEAKATAGEEAQYHSTVWVNRGGKWLAIFHHGTPGQKAPAK